MRLGPKPDTVIEWLILKLNLAPKPLADTQLAFQFARIIMAATKARLFDALRQGGRTAEEVAIDRGTSQTATVKILDALLAHGYLGFRNGRYELNKLSRKWLLNGSPNTFRPAGPPNPAILQHPSSSKAWRIDVRMGLLISA